MKYIGGYSILDLTDANVSAQALTCYNQDKPVLVYGANGERYFADTITKSGTSFIITKGGKTITIANDNTITNVGDIQNHLYRLDVEFEMLDENEDFITYAVISILSTDKNMLEHISMLTLKDYLVANGYNTNGKGLLISATDYLSILVDEDKIMITKKDDTLVEISTSSNLNDSNIIQLF